MGITLKLFAIGLLIAVMTWLLPEYGGPIPHSPTATAPTATKQPARLPTMTRCEPWNYCWVETLQAPTATPHPKYPTATATPALTEVPSTAQVYTATPPPCSP